MGEAKRTHQKHGRHVDGSAPLDPSYTVANVAMQDRCSNVWRT